MSLDKWAKSWLSRHRGKTASEVRQQARVLRGSSIHSLKTKFGCTNELFAKVLSTWRRAQSTGAQSTVRFRRAGAQRLLVQRPAPAPTASRAE